MGMKNAEWVPNWIYLPFEYGDLTPLYERRRYFLRALESVLVERWHQLTILEQGETNLFPANYIYNWEKKKFPPTTGFFFFFRASYSALQNPWRRRDRFLNISLAHTRLNEKFDWYMTTTTTLYDSNTHCNNYNIHITYISTLKMKLILLFEKKILIE